MKINYSTHNELSVKTMFGDTECNKVLLAVHGFSSSKDSSIFELLAQEIVDSGYVVVSFDLPSHGESRGEILNLQECIDSVSQMYDYVADTYHKPISIIGSSFGGYLTLNFASTSNAKLENILLRAPGVFIDEVLIDVILPIRNHTIDELQERTLDLGKENKELWVDYKFCLDCQTNRLEDIININQKVYVVQGDSDTFVNAKKNEEFFNTYMTDNVEIKYLSSVGHKFDDSHKKQAVEYYKNILIN